MHGIISKPRVISLLLCTLFTLFPFATSSTNFCPPKCHCTRITVDCTNAGLFEIPQNLGTSIKSLILRNNRIYHLKRGDFKNLRGLQNLVLTGNRISHVDESFLDELPEVRRLSLAKNRLKNLESLSTFEHRFLSSLNLRHNFLEKIVGLENLANLVQLDISHNRLQSFSGVLPKLQHLHVQHNPWNCDCRISHLTTLLRHQIKNIVDEEMGYCRHPRRMPLLESTVDVEKCEIPRIEDISEGNEIRLICDVENGGKRKNVVWLYKNIELAESALDVFRINETILMVPKGTDVALISCAADYRIPTVGHRKRRQIFAPQFTYKPRDNSYNEGSEVKVNCEVMGSPKPIITWSHNGKPFTSTRKHQLSLSNNILRIYPFLEEDSGAYTCAAQNPHGSVSHDFRLELISSVPPNIYEGPQSLSAKIGGEVVFYCKARGIPLPDYTWSFDGSTIGHIKGRFRVSDDGTELRISNIEKKDEGVFSCMAGNPVGAMSADARLTVEGPGGTQGPQGALPELSEETLRKISQQARYNVEQALEKTRQQKIEENSAVTKSQDLKRLFRFSVPSQAVELSKAREIYEESVRLVREHVEHGLKLDINELHGEIRNVSYESVLHVTHVQSLMGLSGCHRGQFKNPCSDVCFHNKYRSFDGQCNNWKKPMFGVSQMPLRRLLKPAYENGFNTPVGWQKGKLYNGYPMPNVREISRQLVATEKITPHTKLSSMIMQWGQFLDHDLTHTVTALSRHSYSTGAFCNRTCDNLDPCFNIPLTKSDPRLKDGNVKYPCIEFERSAAVCGSGETSLLFDRVTYREQMNALTSFIDASNVYGSTEVQAQELRDTFNNNGKLRFDLTSASGKEYLPFEKDSNMDCRRNFSEENPIRCFLAGDLRANEQLALTATHTIFIREHNRIAGAIRRMNPAWDGEVIYHETRKILGAIMQHITYTQWLPHVFGGIAQLKKYIGGEYSGYREDVDASISNAFATSAFRFGHTLINPTLLRLDKEFEVIKEGNIALHKAFFTPELVLTQGGVDPLIRGLFASPLKHPMPNQLLNMELIEKLFMKGHEVALDLAVMNIQRSRDHGLPSYTEYRKFCNLSIPTTFSDMKPYIKDDMVLQKLQGLYGTPENIDLWVGGIVEEKLEGALFGETFACIIGEQLKKLRDGDRFWYEKEGVFTRDQVREIKKVTLAKIFCDNGDEIDRVQRDVFIYPGGKDKHLYEKCEMLEGMDLTKWSKCCDDVCPTMLDRILRSRHRGSRLHGCNSNGLWRPEGAKWLPENEYCTECVCQGGRVWCATKEDCSDTRSPF